MNQIKRLQLWSHMKPKRPKEDGEWGHETWILWKNCLLNSQQEAHKIWQWWMETLVQYEQICREWFQAHKQTTAIIQVSNESKQDTSKTSHESLHPSTRLLRNLPIFTVNLTARKEMLPFGSADVRIRISRRVFWTRRWAEEKCNVKWLLFHAFSSTIIIFSAYLSPRECLIWQICRIRLKNWDIMKILFIVFI